MPHREAFVLKGACTEFNRRVPAILQALRGLGLRPPGSVMVQKRGEESLSLGRARWTGRRGEVQATLCDVYYRF